jgi:hypothetical protein
MVENAEERQKARSANRNLYDDAIKKVDGALTSLASDKSQLAENDAVAAIEKGVQAYSRIGAQTRSSLPDSIAFNYDKEMTLESDKVGSIDHSFDTAAKNLTRMAVWLSAFLAFFIDMGVPLVIWLTRTNGDVSLGAVISANTNRDRRPSVL